MHIGHWSPDDKMLISVHEQCGIILTRACAKTVWVSPACTHSSSSRYRRLARVSNELKYVLIFVYILNYGCNTSECMNRWSAKGTKASLDWANVHATHIMTWNESCTKNIVFPAGLYAPAEYMEYYSWYRTRTRLTLLSGPMLVDTRSYPEDHTR
jgi:hypothetical protein